MDDDPYYDSNASILEDFLEASTLLPAELHRTSVLLREVDAKAAYDIALLKKSQDEHLDAIVRGAPNAAELGAVVQIHRKRLETRLEEKSVLVQQLFDASDRNLARLTRDIRNIQVILRDSGELEEDAALEPLYQPRSALPSSTPQQPAMQPPPTSPIQHAQQLMQQQQPPAPVPATSTTVRKPLPPPAAGAVASATSSAAAVDHNKYQQGLLVAACTLTATENGQDLWILARIVESPGGGYITVVDAENDAERFTLHERQIVVLMENEDVSHARTRLGSSKGRQVMALYPDTTSFYAATLSQPPFRCNQADVDPSLIGKVCISCIFVDDEDPTTGIAPKRIVPVRLVFTQ